MLYWTAVTLRLSSQREEASLDLIIYTYLTISSGKMDSVTLPSVALIPRV
jgi:hypothetical protein